jgi:hypothetical protein
MGSPALKTIPALKVYVIMEHPIMFYVLMAMSAPMISVLLV